MSFSLTFSAGKEGKISYKNAKQIIYHDCRDLEKDKHKKVNLKAETINPDLTKYNYTVIYDQEHKKYFHPEKISEVFNELDKRVKDVKGRKNSNGSYSNVRKDAICMREVIVQLGNQDNSYYKKYGNDLKKITKDKSFQDMISFINKTFGGHVLYASIHVDEGSKGDCHPHLHIGLDTVYKDKQGVKHFNQKKIGFTGPVRLKNQHKQFYEYMRKKGYYVALDPTKVAKTRKRLDQRTYNQIRDLKDLVKENDQLVNENKKLKEELLLKIEQVNHDQEKVNEILRKLQKSPLKPLQTESKYNHTIDKEKRSERKNKAFKKKFTEYASIIDPTLEYENEKRREEYYKK